MTEKAPHSSWDNVSAGVQHSGKQQFISETPRFNIRYKVKLLGTYKKYYQKN